MPHYYALQYPAGKTRAELAPPLVWRFPSPTWRYAWACEGGEYEDEPDYRVEITAREAAHYGTSPLVDATRPR